MVEFEQMFHQQILYFTACESHLVQHLNTVLTELVVVVGFPWSPVGEGHHMFVRPGEHARNKQVIQTSPHVAGGCKGIIKFSFKLQLNLYFFLPPTV